MHGARAQQAAPLREGTAHVGAPLAAPTLTNCEQIPRKRYYTAMFPVRPGTFGGPSAFYRVRTGEAIVLNGRRRAVVGEKRVSSWGARRVARRHCAEGRDARG